VTNESNGQVYCRVDLQTMIARVVISNKARRNALTKAMWENVGAAFRGLSADPQVRCIVLEGEGEEAFASGGDIDEFERVRISPDSALAYHEEAVVPALNAIAECPIPTVAAIRGACVGGGLEMACCCDLRIASESAFFGVPIMKLGFSMYPEEMRFLLSLVGPALVLELLLEGRLLKADEALQKGLVARTLPEGVFAAQIEATALRIASGAPGVARAHKHWVKRLQDPVPLSRQEKEQAFAFLATQDYREGLRAFLEKRAPRFTGQ
jgi:enoyl-CoA hydratase